MSAPTLTFVPVAGDCNCRCEACPIEPAPPVTADTVRARAEAERPAVLVLTGPGEPTLHPDLPRLIHAARRGGAGDVALVTNGRALAYPRTAARIAGLRPAAVAVTLRHPEAATHDELVRVPGAHTQALAGIRNLAQQSGDHTAVLARAVPHPALRGQLARLWDQARAQGATALWLDGDDEALQREAAALHDAGAPVVVGGAVAALIGHHHDPDRSREGWVPARFHEDEGAISLVIRTGCRNACVFCTTRIVQEESRAAWPLDDLAVFEPALAEGRERGLDCLRLVAVEPLEHPDLPRLLRVARDLGYHTIDAWTSGRSLADPGHAADLDEAGLTDVDIPLLGSTAEIHDAVAGAPGSFDETIRGIAAAVLHFEVRSHLILVRDNLGDLPGMLALAGALGMPQPATVLVPSPSSADDTRYRAFAPRWGDLARAVAALPAAARDGLLRRGLGHQVPPCVLERVEGIDRVSMRAVSRPAGHRVGEGELDQPGAGEKLPSRCPFAGECAAADRCPGIHTLYRQVFGDGEFVPL